MKLSCKKMRKMKKISINKADGASDLEHMYRLRKARRKIVGGSEKESLNLGEWERPR